MSKKRLRQRFCLGEKIINLILLSVFLLCALTLFSILLISAFTGEGDGSLGNPFKIRNCTQLQEINENLSAHYKLMEDINCSDTINWENILTSTCNEFNGDDETCLSTDGCSQSFFDQNCNDAFGGDIENCTSTEGCSITPFNQNCNTIDNVENCNYYGDGILGDCVWDIEGGVCNGLFWDELCNGFYWDGICQGDYIFGITKGFTPIGNNLESFTGTLDGSNFKIIDLYINDNLTEGIGLFGYSEGEIFDLGLERININGVGVVGGLAGYNTGPIRNSYTLGIVNGNQKVGGIVGENNGEILNSYSNVSITGVTNVIGGLAGENNGDISYSYFNGNLNGVDYIGGLAGENNGNIFNSYSIGSITSREDSNYVGGLVGINQGINSIIENSYSMGEIRGKNYVGGLAGENNGDISYSYFNGSLICSEDSNYVGGLVGINDGGVSNIENSYFIGDISGENYVGGLAGGNDGEISNSYSIANIIGLYSSNYVGGLVGYNINLINNSYSEGDVNGRGDVGGLVGQNNGEISNSYSNSLVSGLEFVGGLVGGNDGFVYNSYSSSLITSYGIADAIGGLAGGNSGVINFSYSIGSLNGTNYVGGLVGENNGEVYNSYSKGNVIGSEDSTYIGGLVGINNGGDAVIETSYSKGDVLGNNYVGGLAGENQNNVYNSYSRSQVTGENYIGGAVGQNNGEVYNSYSTGSVNGVDFVGGLIGYNNGGNVLNSFWDNETSEYSLSNGGTGKTTLQMKNISTFTKLNGEDLTLIWDFVGNYYDDNEFEEIWGLGNNYPYLNWEGLDSTPPYFTTIPSNQQVVYGINWNGVNFEAEDENGFDDYDIDDETNFVIDSAGFLNWTGQLNIGNYFINITIRDDEGNINSVIYNLNVTEVGVSTPIVMGSSGGGGGGNNNINSSISGKETRIKLNKTVEKKDKDPLKLFDIRLGLSDIRIQSSSELEAIIEFDSFGNVPTLVNLTYKILNSDGDEVYYEKRELLVETSEVIRKTFGDLNLSEGRYKFVLTTIYGANVEDDFSQNFSIGEERLFPLWLIYALAGFIILVGIIVFIYYFLKGKEIKREKNIH